MREIEFRAWLPELKKMVIPTAIRFMEKGIAIEYMDAGQRCMDGPGFIKLMQYTGMKDENGTKIFEGDIVQFVYDPLRVNRKIIGAVEMNEHNHSCIFTKKTEGFPKTEFHIENAINGEVVGNIHDNPELLQEEK